MRPQSTPRFLTSEPHEIAKADMIDGLRKGLEVICVFDHNTPELTQSELAQRLNLSRAAARRYLMTLVALGYMGTDGRSFWLTPKIMRLGQAFTTSARLPRTLLPVMQRLTDRLEFSTTFSVLDGTDSVCVCRVNAQRLLSTNLEPGTRISAALSASGRMLMSLLSPATIDELFTQFSFYPHTPETVASTEQLRAELALCRKQGFSLAENQFEMGLRGIAVPLFDNNQQPIGALNIFMPTSVMPAQEAIETYIPYLQEAAAQIHRQI